MTFENIWKVYGDGTVAVRDLSLDIGDGEFVVLVGPSGCGKTTALRMVAGLEEISGGELRIGDRTVNEVPAKDRDIAMVFQSYALYPHLTVFENIAFGLRLQKVEKAEVQRRVTDAARVLGLEPYLQRKPRALSGGQRQRVAMGRAIVRRPRVFLMDEPLSNLDAKLRVQTRAEISRLQSELGVTTIYVTHDQVEAMTMGDRVAVMRKGVLQQVAPPQVLYDEPANLFVAGFIGSPAMNLFAATITQDGDALYADLGDARLPVTGEVLARRPALREYAGREVVVGIRPEDLEDPAHARDPESPRLRGRVILREALGSEIVAHLATGLRDVDIEPEERGVDPQEAGTPEGGTVPAGETPLVARISPRSGISEGDSRAGRGRHGPPLLRSRERSRDLRRGTGDWSIRMRRPIGSARRPFTLLAAMAAALALLAGCGGSDSGSGGGGGSTAAGDENVKGTVSMTAVWSGDEQAKFQKVLDGFREKYPNVTVRYTSGGDQLPTVLSTAVQGGNPPDLAAVAQPGLVKDFAARGALKPIDFAQDTITQNYSQGWVDQGKVDGKLYGLYFKGANKSTVWFNPQLFDDAGVEPPANWEDFIAAAKTLEGLGRPGVLHRRRRRLDPHRPVREHLPAVRRPREVRPAGEPRDPVDRPLGDQRPHDDEGRHRRPAEHRGRHRRGPADRVPHQRRADLRRQPQGRHGHRGRLRAHGPAGRREPREAANGSAGRVRSRSVEDARIRHQRPHQVMMFAADRPQARLVEETPSATPEAAQIWVEQGGFSSPNKNVDENAYQDDPADRHRAGRRRDVPVRPVRPSAGLVRRHRRPGDVEGLPLPAQPEPPGHRPAPRARRGPGLQVGTWWAGTSRRHPRSPGSAAAAASGTAWSPARSCCRRRSCWGCGWSTRR
ncbi:MAG: extracellular solute-binding protein [Thermoleophilia bacterium]